MGPSRPKPSFSRGQTVDILNKHIHNAIISSSQQQPAVRMESPTNYGIMHVIVFLSWSSHNFGASPLEWPVFDWFFAAVVGAVFGRAICVTCARIGHPGAERANR